MKPRRTFLAVLLILLLAAAVAFLILISRGNGGWEGIFRWITGETAESTEKEPTGPTVPPETIKPSETDLPSSSEDILPSESSTEEPTEPPKPKQTLRIGASEFSRAFNPFYASADADRAVMDLTQVKLLTLDRSGTIVTRAIEGETIPYTGIDYTYNGIADITYDYDSKADVTTYHLRLRDDVTFSDGVKMTIDDVIFNYYVLLQYNYEGSESIRRQNIVGLVDYYYNKDGADQVTVTEEEIAARLEEAKKNNPGDSVSAYIQEIIRRTLESERDFWAENWNNYPTFISGDSPQVVYYDMYGFDLNYALPGKTMEEVCEKLINDYGLNYILLAEKWAVDEHYFDEEICAYIETLLRYDKIEALPNEGVDYIAGIIRTGDFSMDLQVKGFDSSTIYDLFDIYVAPLHYYGIADYYDYDAHRFGLFPGMFELNAQQWSVPVGAGPFVFASAFNEAESSLTLTANPSYYQGSPNVDYVRLITIPKEGYSSQEEAFLYAVYNDMIDIANISASRELYDQIRMMNANGLLTGDRILTDRFDSSGFSYIGINAATVNVGGSLSGDASKALRKALATLFAVYRYEACSDFYGDSASVIEYPVSDAFWAAPRENDFGYRKAYSHTEEGELYDPSMTDEERYAVALEACKKYLVGAGYVFDETGTTVLSAPEGAPLRFEVLLCPDESGISHFDTVLDRVKTVLHGLGLVLDIRNVRNETEMWVALHMGNVQIWCTSWSGQDPDYYHHYHSSQRDGVGYNFFTIDDFNMDLLLDNMNSVEDRTSQAQVYRVLMELVEDWGIEVPYLQLQSAVIYNAERVDVDSLRNEDVTPYWSWLEQASYISVKPEEP